MSTNDPYITPDAPTERPTPYYPYTYQSPPPFFPQRTNGLAVAALVLGIVWLFWLGSALAIVFGHVAVKQIEQKNEGGKGLAVAGLVLGYIGAATFALFVVLPLLAAAGARTVGLDTSHDAWHGAYSAFNRWRDMLAEVAGYLVEPSHIRKYSDPATEDEFIHASVLLDWGHVTEANLSGEWRTMPHDIHGQPDPLLILLAHSDCDGTIYAKDCGPLADRLEELLPSLPSEPGAGHIGDWRAKTQHFIDGLRRAAAAGEDVEFY